MKPTTTTTSPPPLPLTQRALTVSAPGKLSLSPTHRLPTFSPAQVLVHIHAVALNPSDYKFLDLSPSLGAISGADFSGTVVAIGSDCTKSLKIGDRVCSCVFGSNPLKPGNGAFAEYVAIRSELCIKLPGRMSLEAGASMPVALITAAYVVRSLRLPGLPVLGPGGRMDVSVGKTTHMGRARYVLVNGGATATGTILIQVLREIGCLPIATCSSKNAGLVTSYGALKTFDYAAPDCAKKIRAYTKDKLDCVLDCIGSAVTMAMCYQAIGKEGGRYTALEPYSERIKATREDVLPDWILAWTVYGERVALNGVYNRPPILEDFMMCSNWITAIEPYLAAGKIKAHPLEVNKTDGLEGIEKGLDLMRRGKVSGKKLVYTLHKV